jgi:hypothetical protein
MGAFYYAAKAFDVLERLDPDPEYWEGKRGACMGVFQQARTVARWQTVGLQAVVRCCRLYRITRAYLCIYVCDR